MAVCENRLLFGVCVFLVIGFCSGCSKTHICQHGGDLMPESARGTGHSAQEDAYLLIQETLDAALRSIPEISEQGIMEIVRVV
jgi:hypothetical protein